MLCFEAGAPLALCLSQAKVDKPVIFGITAALPMVFLCSDVQREKPLFVAKNSNSSL